MRRALLLALALTSTTAIARPAMPKMTYPDTRRVDQVDEQFGVKVADPYRWLENDVRKDPEVAAWVAAENKVTDAYLATLPGRDIFKDRLTKLINYERFGVPVKKGGHYFYSRNAGLQNQAPVYVRDRVNGPGRLLIDPNTLSKDGATALGEWVPSEDGSKLLYTIQDGGTDWRIVHVLDVASGQVLPDTIEWSKFSAYSWAKDGSGFYYSRFPEPPKDAKYQTLNENQSIHFHRLGTPQSADTLVFADLAKPKRNYTGFVTDDGKWMVIYSSEGSTNNGIAVLDLSTPGAKPRVLVDTIDNEWAYAGNVGSKFYWKTDKGAPRLRVVTTDVAGDAAVHEVVPEDRSVLDSAGIVGGKLIAEYLVDVKSEVRRFDLNGKPAGIVPIPGIGSVGGFSGDQNDSEAFFSFASFNYPTWVLRYDVKSNRVAVWAKPKVAFDPETYRVDQVFYPSKDGTKIPMFVVKRKDVKGPAPTLLYAYGGFNISTVPSFSATRIAWLEQGGVLAVANIRGGGEYGKDWHESGTLQRKQNVFDDFIAAGEYLKAKGVTTKDGLAVQGGSNGGLLVGAVTNQRPDLFQAALPAVGVMDMLRFDRFTAGRYWVGDYGVPAKEQDFKALYAYSPYHNVRSGKDYPAILASTADTDDRVVPGHTFKYTAAIQAAAIGDKPHLVMIETRAGHGSGKPTDKVIAETASLWAFAAKWTGLDVKPVQ